MFFLCECGKMIYVLSEDCSFCGRKISSRPVPVEAGEQETEPRLFDKKQMRLFEC